MENPLKQRQFLIGTYILAPYARTEAHIRDLAACGIDFVAGVNYDKTMLDLFLQYRVGALVNGVVPGWWGGDGSNAGTRHQSYKPEQYELAGERFVDHPAVWGIDVGDEPAAADLPCFGKIVRKVEQLFPNQIPYLNLYPSYGRIATNTPEEVRRQLGSETYAGYIDAYCEAVETDYICYDHYLYTSSPEAAMRDLETVSEACRRCGRRMWIVLQVNSRNPEQFISENQLRFQAYSAMAYGAETILWACYTAGWFHNQVLDKQGEKTEQYGKLQTVNLELKRLAPHFMRYRNVKTHSVGMQEISFPGDISGFRERTGARLLVGEMVSRDGFGGQALMICAAQDPMDASPEIHTVQFHSQRQTMTLITGSEVRTLRPDGQGIYRFDLPSCHGALLFA